MSATIDHALTDACQKTGQSAVHDCTHDDPSTIAPYRSPLKFTLPNGPLGIVIIACGASKQATPSAAKDLYTGRHFQLCRAYAERFSQAWCIISAKHRIVHPDQIIAPYDARMPSGKRQIAKPGSLPYQCAYWLNHRLDLREHPGSHLTVLAGANYAAVFTVWGSHFLKNVTWSFPLAGMGIGTQDAWLQRQLGLQRRSSPAA